MEDSDSNGLLGKINRAMGAPIYGLPTGMVTNTLGRMALMKARLDSGNYPGFRIPEEPYQHLDFRYDEEFIRELREAVTEGLESEQATVKKVDGKVIQRTVTNAEFKFSEHADFARVFQDDVREAIEDYLGCSFSVESARAFRSYYIPPEKRGEIETTYNWHIDKHSPATVQFFIPLTDVNEDCGPTEIVDASPLEFSEEARDVKSLVDISPGEVEKMTSETGRPYIFNPSRRLHRAGYVSEGEDRYLIFFRLAPSSSPLPEDWPERPPFRGENKQLATGLGQFRHVI